MSVIHTILPVDSNTSFRLSFGNATDAGRSGKQNEDSYGVFAISPTNAANPPAALLVVADGIGGAVAGERASRVAVETIHRVVAAETHLAWTARLETALQTANRAICADARNEALDGMGTTVVVAVIDGVYVWIAHVGDSRAYLVRHGVAHLLTVDHTRVQEGVDAGALTNAEASVHPNRHVITRNLGVAGPLEIDLLLVTPVSDQPGLPPQAQRRMVESLELEPGDTLLLCTDGLHDLVPDETIQFTVISYPPPVAASRLIELANAAGGTDNITVVLAAWPAPPTVTQNGRRRAGILLAGISLLLVLAAYIALFSNPFTPPESGAAPVTVQSTTVIMRATSSPEPTLASTPSPAPTGTSTFGPPTVTAVPARRIATTTATPSVTATPTETPVRAPTEANGISNFPTPTDAPSLPPSNPSTSTDQPEIATPTSLATRTEVALATIAADTTAPSVQKTSPFSVEATAIVLPEISVTGETALWAGSGDVCFSWLWAGMLDQGQAFELFIWREASLTDAGASEQVNPVSALNVEELNGLVTSPSGGKYEACFEPQFSEGFRDMSNGSYAWSVAVVVEVGENHYRKLKESGYGVLEARKD